MHSARLNNSERLQRVHALLRDGSEHTTLDIIKRASVCAVNSVVSELRDNGFSITCERRGDIWYYKMVAG